MKSNPIPNSKPFQKGDPRINRKGRPSSFDALRELAQEIAHEKATAKGETVVIDGHAVTVAEMILRQWAQSKNPQLQRQFVEVAFGKVPQTVELAGRGGGPIKAQIDLSTLSNEELEQLARIAARVATDPG